MNIQTLTAYFLQRLNNNTQTFDGQSVTFNLGYLVKSSDTKYEFKTFENYFTETTTKYTPAMVTYVADPLNIPSKDATDWTLLFEILLTGEKETDPRLVAEFNALEEFRLSLVNNPIDTEDGYKLIISPKPIQRTGGILLKGGQKRLTVSMEVRLQSSVGLISGNEIGVELALKGETLQPLIISTVNIVNGKLEQTDGDLSVAGGTTKTISEQGTTKYDVSFLYDNSDLQNEIVKGITALETDINKKYDLKLVFPIFNVPKTVILLGGTVLFNIGDNVVVNATFAETI